ncbi:hypothetical protein NS228_06045 [Methylobacterium indicum]|uniref:hypothetical protein n=1 Tax=Methylobacterium indicum TaxID=1775910 RepID=UPI000734B433|nr:hypothetical protein [Methylobacterium indicum]KTS30888.1 hypothetical protein NS229_14785 [Methylobacterium indicum]KTS41524.1 hypothetical protein NS228_06045 [Methylobacterium indicum]KTS52422.1 hypothetical protein NS230_09870 [Methylobacterium indicum]
MTTFDPRSQAWIGLGPDEIVRRVRCEADDAPDEGDSPAQIWREACDMILLRMGKHPSQSPTPDGVIKETGEDGLKLAPEVEARVMTGLSRDGWEEWDPTDDHALRVALLIDGMVVALLEAFSRSGPWYANAISPEGERHRLGAGRSLSSAVQWCEVTTGYVVAPASTVQPPSSQESGVGETEGWVLLPREPTPEMIAAGWANEEDVGSDDIWAAMIAAAPRPSQREG